MCAPRMMFSDSHMPGLQTLTNGSTRFKYLIMGVALSASEWKCVIE